VIIARAPGIPRLQTTSGIAPFSAHCSIDSSQMKFALFAVFCLLSFPSVLPLCNNGLDRPSITEVSGDSVTYQSRDGVRIGASWFYPQRVTNPPVVILLHERDGTRAQWNDLIPILIKDKYAVLAPDLRGYGESTTVVRDGQEQPYQFGNPQAAVLDVDAALSWLQTRNDVDLSRIGIIGARFGADLAYLSTGGFPAVRAGIAMTPDPYAPDDPLYSLLPDFAAHDVFIMAGGRREWEEAVTLGVRVTFPKGRRYLETPDLDGVGLLANDQTIRDILDWLKTRVATPRPSPSAPPSPAPLPSASPQPSASASPQPTG